MIVPYYGRDSTLLDQYPAIKPNTYQDSGVGFG